MLFKTKITAFFLQFFTFFYSFLQFFTVFLQLIEPLEQATGIEGTQHVQIMSQPPLGPQQKVL